ncbi:MAG: tetratricopeptide repeat protein [Planctomycetota bacterium]
MGGGRFSSLEFDDGGGGETPPASRADAPTTRRPKAAGQVFGNELRDGSYYVTKAQTEELAGDHEKALRSYSAALGEDPLLLEAWVGQLLMLLELGEYPEARLWADKALEKFPDNPQLLAAKSVALLREGFPGKARELNDAALARKGEAEVAWLGRAEIMLAGGNVAGEECLSRALALSRHKGLTRLRAGAVALRCGRHAAALPILREATTDLARSAKVWYLLGRAQEECGLTTQAMTSYRQAVGLAPLSDAYRAALSGQKERAGGIAGFFRRLLGK